MHQGDSLGCLPSCTLTVVSKESVQVTPDCVVIMLLLVVCCAQRVVAWSQRAGAATASHSDATAAIVARIHTLLSQLTYVHTLLSQLTSFQ